MSAQVIAFPRRHRARPRFDWVFRCFWLGYLLLLVCAVAYAL